MKDLLTSHQAAVVEEFLAEEKAKRTHLVISLSGAHAYGFPSPDSDFDLKAIHIDHRFHGKSISCSTGSRSPIPREADQ